MFAGCTNNSFISTNDEGCVFGRWDSLVSVIVKLQEAGITLLSVVEVSQMNTTVTGLSELDWCLKRSLSKIRMVLIVMVEKLLVYCCVTQEQFIIRGMV